MLTTQKIILLPLLVLLCLVVSHAILYASPETLHPVIHHFDVALATASNKIWPSSKDPPSLQQEESSNKLLLDLPDLRGLCARTRWDPDLAIHCHSRCGRNQTSFCGGINNARDRLQTCLRLAVDAGATTIVIPSLAARSEKRLATINPAAIAGSEDEVVEVCADAWFDIEWLKGAFGGHCPQTKIKVVCPTDGNEDTAQLVGATRVVQLPWRSVGETKYAFKVGYTFREAVESVLLPNATVNINNANNKAGDALASTSNVTLMQIGDTYLAWDYKRSEEQTTIFKDLFQTVRFSPALRALGQRITAQQPLRDASYIGVHLRGENDWPAEWGSLEEQTRLYAGDVETLRLRDEARGLLPVRTIYVSCGNRTSIQYFRERIESLGYSVLDKWTLLETNVQDGWPEGLATVEALSFDEKAIVEYEPLVRSRYFLGISYSSMSFVIATARTLREPGDFMEVFIEGGGDGLGGTEEKGITEVRGNEHTRLIYVNID